MALLSFYRPHPRYFTDTSGPSMTKQSHKAECDIHNILKQYQRTGIITHIRNSGASFEDLPSDIDFQSSLNLILSAEAAFSSLPASVRAKYSNDPAQLLAALTDPTQAQELRDLGILKALAPTPPPGATPPLPADDN